MALLLGTTTDGVSGLGNTFRMARRFQAVATGTLDEIQVYSVASGNVKVALYSDNAGEPDARLVSDAVGTAVSAAAWNKIPVSDVAISAGTYYWIAAQGDTTGCISQSGTAAGDTRYYTGSYASWTPPDPWPTALDTPSTLEVAFAGYSGVTELLGGTFSLTGGTVETTRYQQLTGGTYALTGGAVETDYDALVGGTFSMAGGSLVNSRLQVASGGTYALTGGAVDALRTPTGGIYALTGGSVVNSRSQVPTGGTFSLTGGSVTTSRLQMVSGGVYTLTGGTVGESQSSVALYRDVLADASAIFACNAFGNDTDGNYVWERIDTAKDLILGDGSTSSTFPTFTTAADGVEYYAFDGVDDYVGNWPTAGFVSAALSSSYPGGQPYVTQVTDDTVENLLTVGGAFTGNLHSLVFFDTEPTEDEKRELADYQLRRMWRDTIIDPYTARLVRNGEAVQVYEPRLSPCPYEDYAIGSTATPSGVVFNDGLTFSGSSSVVTVPDAPELRLSQGATMFAAGDISAGGVISKGSNYSLRVLSVPFAGVQVNGVAVVIPTIAAADSVAVTLQPGSVPRVYVNGEYYGSGATPITMPTGSDDLLIGNILGGGFRFTGTLNAASVFNRILTDAEIRLLHYRAILGASETQTRAVITDIDGDDTITSTQTDVILTCTQAGSTTGKVYLTDSSVFSASSVVVEQSVDSWSDTSIQFDVVPGGLL